MKAFIQLCCLLCCVVAVFAGEIIHTYDYTGSDTNKNVLVKGLVTLRVDETNRVKGAWTLKILDVKKMKALGHQDGAGKIVGRMDGDTVFLNLNPEYYENNVFLDGKVAEANIARINGRWGYYGFAGKVSEGEFEMVAKDVNPTPPTNAVSPRAEPPAAKPPSDKPGP